MLEKWFSSGKKKREQETPVDVSRRNFIAGGGALVVAAAAGIQKADAAPLDRKAQEKQILAMRDAQGKEMPLVDMVSYMTKELSKGGYYYNRLHSEDFSKEDFDTLFKLVSSVSGLMTAHFEEAQRGKPIPKGMEKYFDLSSVQDAVMYFPVRSETQVIAEGQGFYVQSQGDIYHVTDEHVIRSDIDAKEYFKDPYADIAVRYVPEAEWRTYAEGHGMSPEKLPLIDVSDTTELSSGSVISTISSKSDGIKYASFSFAIPLTKSLMREMYTEDVIKRAGEDLLGTMVHVLPPGEGRILEKDASGRITRVGASGRSGSMIAAHLQRGYVPIGNLINVKSTEIGCSSMCYTISHFSSPDTLREMIMAERKRRLEKDSEAVLASNTGK